MRKTADGSARAWIPGLAGFVVFGLVALRAADPAASLTPEQKEEFLRTAKIVASHGVAKGVTQTTRVTLSDGKVTHDASVQRIDDYKTIFKGDNGSSEVNFKDTYKFNVAAWKLAQHLGLDDMIPPSVERKYSGTSAAYTWWIDDVMMDDVERTSKKIQSPNAAVWNQDMYVLRVFDQLIFNTDRNETNVLIDKQWRVWMIDHSRAFRLQRELQNPKNLVQCDRDLLAKMKSLDQPTLEKLEKGYLTKEEIRGILARRDLIVKFFEKQGDSALYERPRRI